MRREVTLLRKKIELEDEYKNTKDPRTFIHLILNLLFPQRKVRVFHYIQALEYVFGERKEL